MQTVYILKNCLKSYRALMLLYQKPDISTNIIIVDGFHYKLLKLDKRVTKFPFIINTAPTNTGMIPKIARVLPLELFIDLTKPVPEERAVVKRKPIVDKHLKYMNQQPYKRNYAPKRPPINITKGVPIIRKTSDGGVNIVLN